MCPLSLLCAWRGLGGKRQASPFLRAAGGSHAPPPLRLRRASAWARSPSRFPPASFASRLGLRPILVAPVDNARARLMPLAPTLSASPACLVCRGRTGRPAGTAASRLPDPLLLRHLLALRCHGLPSFLRACCVDLSSLLARVQALPLLREPPPRVTIVPRQPSRRRGHPPSLSPQGRARGPRPDQAPPLLQSPPLPIAAPPLTVAAPLVPSVSPALTSSAHAPPPAPAAATSPVCNGPPPSRLCVEAFDQVDRARERRREGDCLDAARFLDLGSPSPLPAGLLTCVAAPETPVTCLADVLTLPSKACLQSYRRLPHSPAFAKRPHRRLVGFLGHRL